MRAIGLALVITLAACQQPTELLLVLSTDFPDGRYDEIGLDVNDNGADAATFSRTYLVPAEARLPGSIELHPAGGDPTIKIDATLFDAGAMLVTRQAIVTFEPQRSLELRLELQQSCALVACADGDTCVDGTCESGRVDPSMLSPISGEPLAPVDMADGHLPAEPADLAGGAYLLGTTEQLHVDFCAAGTAEAFQEVATATGMATSASVYIDPNNGATEVLVGIYSDDSAGQGPGTLLTSGTITLPVSGQFNTAMLQSVELTAGTTYWIAVLSPVGQGTLRLLDADGGGSAGASQTEGSTALTTLPMVWNPGVSYPKTAPLSAFVR